MHSSLYVLLFSPIAAIAATTSACNADKCLRSIRATNTPGRVATGSADCSSFLKATFTSATYTSTTTVTVQAASVVSITSTFTSTISVPSTITSIFGGLTVRDAAPTQEAAQAKAVKARRGDATHIANPVPEAPQVTARAVIDVEKRQATSRPTAIPAYASFCSGAVRYSSACSCIGFKATTVTAATPSTTTTVYTTTTSTFITSMTVTSNIAAPTTITVCQPPSYGIDYSGGYIQPSPGQTGVDTNSVVRDDITSQQGCCAACYQTPGCYLHYLPSGTCNLLLVSSGSSPLASSQCPSGPVLEFADYSPGQGYFGFGSCAIYSGPPP